MPEKLRTLRKLHAECTYYYTERFKYIHVVYLKLSQNMLKLPRLTKLR